MERWEQAFHEGNDGLQRLLDHTNMKWNPCRPRPPVEAPGHEPDEMEDAMSRLNWLRRVEGWLWHLVFHIEDSLDKNFDMLAAWNKKSGHLDFPGRVNSGIISSEEEEQKIAKWKEWIDLQDHSGSCSRTSSFCGGYYIPKIDGAPTSMQMEHVSHFFNYHHSEMSKHYDHLKYLHDLINHTLLVDVGSKIEQLMHEIDVLEMLLPTNNVVVHPLRYTEAEGLPVLKDSIEDEFWVFSDEKDDYQEDDCEVDKEVTIPSGGGLSDLEDKKLSMKNLVIGSDETGHE